MSKRKTPEKIENDRNHHLSFFKDTYNEMGFEWAWLCMDVEKILVRLSDIERTVINIDANRRENAISMGVSIIESDQVYNFDNIRKGVPELIKKLKEIKKQFGLGDKNDG